MEVWAVTEGEYSDYHVVCVCPSEETANATVEKLMAGSLPTAWGKRYRVEPFLFFNEPPDVVYQLHMDIEDVESGDEPREFMTGYLSTNGPKHDCYHWVNVTYREPFMVSLNVNGMDHERVRKTFSEQRAQAKAEAPILIAARRAEVEAQRARYGATGGIVGTSIDGGIRKSP